MNLKTATFGSGCFWCTEAIFELVEGVNDGDIVQYDKHSGFGISVKNTLYYVISIRDVVIIE